MSKEEKKQLDLGSSSSYSSSSSSSSSSAPSSSDDDSDNESFTKNTKKNNKSSNDGDNKLIINSKFAKEYEKRKRKQELTNDRQRRNQYSSLGLGNDSGDESSSSSDESEDENGELLTPKVDLQILKTINKLRKKDESIYKRGTKFYTEDDNDDSNKQKKHKRKLYKDMVRDEIMQKMDDDNNDQSSNDDDNDKNDNAYDRDSDYVSTRDNVHKLAYDEEQVNLRSAFLNDDDDDDDSNNDDAWLKKKSNKNNTSDDQIEKDRLEEIANLTATTNTATSSADNSTILQDPKGEVEDGEEFLFDFIKNKRWVDHDTFDYNDDEEEGARYPPTDEYDKGNDSDGSLNDLNKTDEFESRYNFRFEEANNTGTESGAGLSVVGYARSSLSDTIRRKDESRKMKRKQRKERKMEERKAKEEKLKRLKNAKREELEERISQVKGVLSDKTSEIPDDTVNEELVAKLMDGDFDPDKFEDLMSKMYDDNYYEQEDGDWKNDSDVKQSLMESGLQEDKEIITELEDREGEDFHDDVEEYDAGQEDFGEDEQDGVYDEEAEYQEDYQDEKKVENVLDKKLNDRMMDELYKLDYEDIIGDMPTRFKYRKVESNRYGLRPEEILFSRDTTLKQFVSLKRMAPYEEEGEYLPGTKRRKRFREMAKADLEEVMKESEKADSSAMLGNDIESTEQPEKKKRRRQKKGKKKKNQLDDTDQTTDQIENSIDTKPKQENDPTPTKTKGRKKKGKKIKKNSNTDCLGGKKEKYSDKSDSKRSGSKRKSKKEDGMSESRLASYTF